MAKRFTDNEIWNDPWFRKLPLEGKVFWRFLLDRCDVAGYWKKDYEMMSFQCGFDMTDVVLQKINEGKERVKDHGTHLEIVDFITFQYGTLKPEVKPHRPIIKLLEYYQSKGFRKGIKTLEEQDKDKDKEKERGSVRGDKFTPPSMEEVRNYCLERRNGVDAQQFVDFYTSKGWKVGDQTMKDWKASVRTWEKRQGNSPSPPKKCKECKKDAGTSWVQVSGGIVCGECFGNSEERSAGKNKLEEMKAGVVKSF